MGRLCRQVGFAAALEPFWADLVECVGGGTTSERSAGRRAGVWSAKIFELARVGWRMDRQEKIMKLLRLVSIVMLSVCALAHGQSSAKPVASSDAQKSFDLLKTLAGTWKGPITTDNAAWSTDQLMPLSIRVASSGNALIHELSTPGPEPRVTRSASTIVARGRRRRRTRVHAKAQLRADPSPRPDGQRRGALEIGEGQVGRPTDRWFLL